MQDRAPTLSCGTPDLSRGCEGRAPGVGRPLRGQASGVMGSAPPGSGSEGEGQGSPPVRAPWFPLLSGGGAGPPGPASLWLPGSLCGPDGALSTFGAGPRGPQAPPLSTSVPDGVSRALPHGRSCRVLRAPVGGGGGGDQALTGGPSRARDLTPRLTAQDCPCP